MSYRNKIIFPLFLYSFTFSVQEFYVCRENNFHCGLKLVYLNVTTSAPENVAVSMTKKVSVSNSPNSSLKKIKFKTLFQLSDSSKMPHKGYLASLCYYSDNLTMKLPFCFFLFCFLPKYSIFVSTIRLFSVPVYFF